MILLFSTKRCFYSQQNKGFSGKSESNFFTCYDNTKADPCWTERTTDVCLCDTYVHAE